MQTEDLGRMYRLFHRIPKGLDPVAELLKQHVESEGNKLVKEVTEEVESKKDKDAGARRTSTWRVAQRPSPPPPRCAAARSCISVCASPCVCVCVCAGKGPTKDTGTPAEQQFVRSVIELHDKYLTVVSTCFNNASLFHKALKVRAHAAARPRSPFKRQQSCALAGRRAAPWSQRWCGTRTHVRRVLQEAFEAFCNKSVAGSTSAELMASFCDNLLKKVRGCCPPPPPRSLSHAPSHIRRMRSPSPAWRSRARWRGTVTMPQAGEEEGELSERVAGLWHARGAWTLQGGTEKLSDEAVEETLEKVVKLLAFISDKDLFAEFYRKKLSRRLLHDKSSSDDHERSILSRLKQQCGAQFTSKVRAARGRGEGLRAHSVHVLCARLLYRRCLVRCLVLVTCPRGALHVRARARVCRWRAW